jgi:ATP-binding cassette subfamily C protein
MAHIRRCLALLDVAGRRRMVLLGLLILIYTGLEVASVGLVLPFIALINSPGLIETNRLANLLYVQSGTGSVTSFLALAGVALFALIVFKNIYFCWVAHLQARFSYFQEARVAGALLERYLAAPFETHLQRNSSDMITTVDYSTELVFSQVLLFLIVFVTEAASICGLVLLMLFIEPQLTLVLGVVLGGCALALTLFLRHEIIHVSETSLRLRKLRLQALQQALNSIKEVKVLGCEKFFAESYRRLRQDFAANQVRLQMLSQIPRPVLEVVVSGGIVMVIVLVLVQGRAAADVIAVLSLFAMAAFRILPSTNRLVHAFHAIKSGSAAVDQVSTDLFDRRFPALPAATPVKPMRFAQAIELRDVSFSYRDSASLVLRNVSLRIGRGESVGLVGASGVGKSTLIDVILGLLEPQQGSVLVDGQDIIADPRPWRALVGYVPQANALIDDTLRNNVAFGVDPKSVDESGVWNAVGLAGLDAFCRSLPDGLDTMIGERGMRLSGGQRQRIGIARALYRNPQVLVLDEATSALDVESERNIGSAIEALHGEKTLLIIAHRLSTVKRCDRIVLMGEGTIADTGTFDELMARREDFREMVRLAETMARVQDRTAALY